MQSFVCFCGVRVLLGDWVVLWVCVDGVVDMCVILFGYFFF